MKYLSRLLREKKDLGEFVVKYHRNYSDCHNDHHLHKIKATENWFRTIVLGQKLCPFAPPLAREHSKALRICSSSSSQIVDIIEEMKAEASYIIPNTGVAPENCAYNQMSSKESKLLERDAAAIRTFPSASLTPESCRPETTLVVFDSNDRLSEFRDFLHLSFKVQREAIMDQGLVDDLQIVVFHPRAQHLTYSESFVEPGDYTIRSPYPTLHLLREMDVLRAVESYKNKDLLNLPIRNKERLRMQGMEVCKSMLEKCYSHSTSNPIEK